MQLRVEIEEFRSSFHSITKGYVTDTDNTNLAKPIPIHMTGPRSIPIPILLMDLKSIPIPIPG